ncbi:conserved protein of unknown function [Methylotuvimicrobium alcaliphilum 20Z]|uniref:GIY-YIG domain-containing protein n=2 Tax=Methylotuvimicrobium alcaliphilum TaxID=271065 RepID=G4SXF9_META2|nr:conserved protein of unknown function [Methylotuvimicrobium alcaliphilum 20Z]
MDMHERPFMIELRWEGPFSWPNRINQGIDKPLSDSTASSKCGVYLWTVEYCGGYLIYAAGITRRPFEKRFREHTRAYLNGVYTVFDVPSLKTGVRKVIWDGFWFQKNCAAKKLEFDNRSEEISIATNELLSNYRVFVAPITPNPRLLERIEAAIMNTLYSTTGPTSTIPDRGMALAPRWPEEDPIRIRNSSPVLLHGLLEEFEA